MQFTSTLILRERGGLRAQHEVELKAWAIVLVWDCSSYIKVLRIKLWTFY